MSENAMNPVQKRFEALIKTSQKFPNSRRIQYTKEFYCQIQALMDSGKFTNDAELIRNAVEKLFLFECGQSYEEIERESKIESQIDSAKKISDYLKELERIDPMKYPKTLKDAFRFDWFNRKSTLGSELDDLKSGRLESFKEEIKRLGLGFNESPLITIRTYELNLITEIEKLISSFSSKDSVK